MWNPRPFAVCAVAASAIVVSACGPDSGSRPAIERSEEDGIEVVTVAGPRIPLEWTFQDTVVIPPEAEGEVRFTDVSPWEVGADREGRVYVLDTTGGRVVVFGRSGRFAGSVGRPGQGPGELSEPMALAVSADGDVAVYDYAAGGIARWGAAGESLPLERPEATFWGPELGVAGWGLLYPALAADGRDGRVVRLVVVAETRTGVLAEMTQSTVLASFPNCGIGGLPVEPIFEPRLQWSIGGDIVAVTTGPHYEIEVFRKGVLERRISRRAEARAASRDLALQEVGDGLQLTAPVRCRVSATELVEARGFAATVPAISGLAVAPDGSLWVRRGLVRGEGEPAIDVHDPDGAYIGTLPAGSPFPVAFAGRAMDYRAISLRPVDTGATEIVVHRIVR